jgi:hypothetical protein
MRRLNRSAAKMDSDVTSRLTSDDVRVQRRKETPAATRKGRIKNKKKSGG